MKALLLALVLAGCADDGLYLESWQLSADDRELGEVTLPSDLSSRIGLARRYTLSSEIGLPPEYRGRELTLGIGFIGGRARVRAGGVDALPLNQRLWRANTHGWRLRAVDGERLRLEITVDYTSWFAAYFGSAPVLSTQPHGATSHRVKMFFNVVCPLLAICTLIILSLIHGVSWLIDRHRREHGWFAAMALLILPFELGNLGLAEPLLGTAHVAVTFGCATLAANLSVFFVHDAFRLDAPPRLFRWLFVPLLVVVALAHDPWSGARFVLIATLALSAPCLINNVVRVARVAWRPGENNRGAALLFVVAWLSMLGSLGVDALMALGGKAVVGTLGNPIGLALFALFSALALAREQTVQVRKSEQLNAELRHQLVEKSRQLVDALVRVGVGNPGAALIGPGVTLANRYRIGRALGQGGMGRVFECVRLSDERRFALKLLTGHPRPESLARFAREASIAAELEHPNLVSVHDVGFSDEGVLFMVMDLVIGASLDKSRQRFGDAAWALPILRQIAVGLAALHARGVIHRDLKPGNVLISDEGGSQARVKIADFGIARLSAAQASDERQTARVTRPGFLAGTPMYMAPELARGFDEAQPAADLFSFGVLAHLLLSGKLPFEGAPVLAALDGRKLPAAHPLAERCRVAPEIARFVDDCLAVDPEARPRATAALKIFRRA